ncbi:MAG: NADH-quinone oxidoreductase subunit A [Verrucomicrobiae bacterium]|nr:NADH-quinone oxidoreductase subunit A [Verrucomicrobiae bacterium]NNJ43071.1 NAD(P)H-quinone oxidoreductase subunit 3 [Akkermansiaceae bacterium]
MNHPYLPVLIFLGVALAVPIGALVLARVWMRFFTPIKRSEEKNALYECGVKPLSERQTRFHSQYYMFGLLFLLFDVETVFLLPFAVAFLEMSVGAFLVAMLFILLLAEGLVWAWSKGLLNWRTNSQPNYKVYGDR